MESQHHFAHACTVMAPLGTGAIQIDMKMLLAAADYNMPLANGSVKHILYDVQMPPLEEADPHLVAVSGVRLLSHSFIEAAFPDRESRERARRSPRFWSTPEQVLLNPASRADGSGTGSDPACGQACFRLNDGVFRSALINQMRQFQDQREHIRQAARGAAEKDGLPVDFLPIVGLPGGTGDGAFLDSCRMGSESGVELKIKVRVLPIMILPGTLPLLHPDVAMENVVRGLHIARVISTGNYLDLEGRDARAGCFPFHSAILVSNCSAHDELGTYAELQSLIAHVLFHLTSSPVGKRLRERLVDIENNAGTDESGARKIGLAMGLSRLSVDRRRVKLFSGCNLASREARKILESQPGDAPAKGAAAAGEVDLVEAHGETQTSNYLTKADAEDPNAFARVKGAFEDRFSGLRWMSKLMAMIAAFAAVSRETIHRDLAARFQKRCEKLRNRVQERVASMLATCSVSPAGLVRAIAWTQALLNQVEQSDRENREKESWVRRISDPAFRELDAIRHRAEELGRMNWIARAFHFFTILFLICRYRTVANLALRRQVELLAREYIQREIHLPVGIFLREQLKDLKAMESRLQEAHNMLERDAEQFVNAKPSVLRTPVGIEVADSEMQQDFYSRVIQARGGEDKALEQVFGLILNKERSLFAFLDKPREQLAKELAELAGMPFESAARDLSVVETFKERFRDRAPGMIASLVDKSTPRIRTVGEANQHVPCKKLVGVPQGSDWEWLEGALKGVDKSGGWERVDMPADFDSVVFMQCRGDVSLTSYIDQISLSGKHLSVAERIRRSIDPLLAVIPWGSMTQEDARVAATYAFLAGQLTQNPEKIWVLKTPEATRELGDTPAKALRTLCRQFPDVVSIYSALGQRMKRQGDDCLSDLRNLASKPPEDAQGFFSEASTRRAKEEVTALLPYLRRLVESEDANG